MNYQSRQRLGEKEILNFKPISYFWYLLFVLSLFLSLLLSAHNAWQHNQRMPFHKWQISDSVPLPISWSILPDLPPAEKEKISILKYHTKWNVFSRHLSNSNDQLIPTVTFYNLYLLKINFLSFIRISRYVCISTN